MTNGRFNRAYFENLKLADLVAWLEKRRDEYYNGVSKVPDSVFDLGEDVLRERSPNNKYFKQVGAKVKTGKKVKLPIPMGSLSKVKPGSTKPGESAEEWLKKAGPIVVVSDKLDGASAEVVNEDGSEGMYSRGDGVVGQDISALLESVHGIGSLRTNEAVRGELVMPNKKFSARWAKKFENPRNLVSGIVNSKDRSAHQAVGDVVFIVHEMLRPHKSLANSAEYLKRRGWKVVPHKTFRNPTVEQLVAYYAERKSKSICELDGLVLYSPKAGTVAFKVTNEATDTAEATVKEIEWRLTRYGIYAPRLILEPTRLQGVTVKHASAYNARNIVNLGIGPGARVRITRSGDVIPKVLSVLKKAKPNLPDQWEWDENKVQIRLPEGGSHDKIVVERITNGLAVLDVPNVRAGLVTKLVAAGFESIADLITASRFDFEEAGLGKTQSNDLANNLNAALKKATHSTMMAASGVFPKGMGTSKFDGVLAKLPYQTLVKLQPRQVMEAVAELHGFSDKTARAFAIGFRAYKQFVKDIGWKPQEQKLDKRDSLYGEVVCFTGIRNKHVEDIIKARGGKVGGLSKATTILIVPIATHNSEKTRKAEKMGIEPITFADFLIEHGIRI